MTREEEIKQAVRMANQLERTRVLAEIEKWLDNTPDAFDEISKQSLRAKLGEMKEGK